MPTSIANRLSATGSASRPTIPALLEALEPDVLRKTAVDECPVPALLAENAMKKLNCLTALRALAEENRLRILRLILSRERTVTEVSETLNLTAYNASKHLRVLKEAGLVTCAKNAQQRIYSLEPEFRQRLAENKNILDLGCCQFDFSKLPK